jgi:hypothetical protein
MGVMETIFAVGDDALGYEYQISLGPIPSLDVATNLLVRATTCEIPEIIVGEYEYDYKSEKVVKPNGKIGTAKEFSIEFRVDKYYNLYKAFKTWNNAIVSPVSGGVATDSNNGISAIRIPITVTTGTYDIEGNFIPTTQIWNFTGCWPKSIGGFTLDNQSGEPVMCSIRFGYLKMF